MTSMVGEKEGEEEEVILTRYDPNGGREGKR